MSIWNKSWKASSTFIPTESSIVILSRQISLWKMVSAKSAILDSQKTWKIKTLLWNLLLEHLFTCLPSCSKRQNTPISLIFGQSDWFIMKCFMGEPHGLHPTNFSSSMEFIQKNLLFIHQLALFLKTLFSNVLKYNKTREWVGKMHLIIFCWEIKLKDHPVHATLQDQPSVRKIWMRMGWKRPIKWSKND